MGGRYEVEALLGVGGMAEVVLARDSALGRRVALKLLAPALVADPMFVERFRREATAIAALSHANVVVVYEHGVAEGQPFIAMEYVPGRTVKQIITEGAPLPPAVAVNYACQALAGLEAAHATGIVHRDIKPQNLLVREDDTLKVADFGVARSAQDTVMTQHGSVIGTADYIAPEQAQGAPAVAASDLYSLGVVLFEMLTGRLPFTGELPLAVASQHALAPAPSVREFNPAVPDALARVVDRALSKTSAVRCQSAAEMKAALTAAMQGDPDATLVARARGADAASAATRVFPRTPGATARPGRARRSARVRALAALVALALLVAVVFAISTRGGGGSAAVRLPSVVGLPVATARSALEDDGFKVGIAPAQHAGEPAGTVARVDPTGPSAAHGALVTITPSSGPRSIRIPTLSGFSQQAATAELERLGFVVAPALSVDPAPRGTVVGTDPPAGTAAPPRSSVTLVVSAGPAPPPTPAPGKAKGPKNKDKHHGHGKPKAK